MNRTLALILGTLFVVAALAGLVFSIVGVIALGRVERQVGEAIAAELALLDQALVATSDGLVIADQAVVRVQKSLDDLGATTGSATQALGDIRPALDEVGRLVTEEVPKALKSAQQSLKAFASAGSLVDNVMQLLSRIRFLELPEYRPEASLSTGAESLAESLAGLPDRLSTVGAGLDQTAQNLEQIKSQVSGFGSMATQLHTSLGDARSVLADYQETASELQEQVRIVRENVDRWLRLARIVLTFSLAWVGVASLGLLVQGWSLLKGWQLTPAAIHPY